MEWKRKGKNTNYNYEIQEGVILTEQLMWKWFRKYFSFLLAIYFLFSIAQETPKIAYAAQSLPTAQFDFSGKLGDILRTLMAQYKKNIAFGTDVDSIPIALQIEASGFEDIIVMIEIAANVEVTKIKDDSYIVRTLAEAQRERDFANSESDRAAQAEKIAREMESEKKRTFEETVERLGSTVVQMFDVKFIAVDDIEKAFDAVFGDDFRNFVRVKALSNDSNRNYSTILVSAPSQYIIDKVAALLKTIDREKPMIEIEALFIEVSLNNQDGLGFDWSIFPETVKYSEIPSALETAMGDLYTATQPGRFARSSPLSVSAQLRQLAGSGKGKVLSNTKLRTMSGRKSYFTSETQEPIMSLNGESEVRVEYKNVGISLESLATVLDDNSIYMKVIPRSSTITGEKTLRDSTAPQISERRVEAEIILNPNETMVISGLMYERDSVTKARVPILSSIPLIGGLFKSNERKTERFQIFIYLRPRLIDTKAGADYDLDAGQEIAELWEHYSKQGADKTFRKPGESINKNGNIKETPKTTNQNAPDTTANSDRTQIRQRRYTGEDVQSRFRDMSRYYEIPESY
jgi:type II secretory pathway component GspD/PulD (secretin)